MSTVNNAGRDSFKIILVGNAGVGKTSLIENFIVRRGYGTIGMDVPTKKIFVGNRRIQLQIWDTIGEVNEIPIQSISASGQVNFGNTDCCVFVFDVLDLNSVISLDEWRKKLMEAGENNAICICLCNKVDLMRWYTDAKDRGEEWAKLHGMPFLRSR